jgi:hypothetical protein
MIDNNSIIIDNNSIIIGSISDTELYVIIAQSKISGALAALEHVSIADSTLSRAEISAEQSYIDTAITLLYKAKQSYALSSIVASSIEK